MVYLKSVLVGFASWFVTTIVYFVILIYIRMRRYTPAPGMGVVVGLTLFSRLLYLLIAIAAFAVGCYWQFRRG